MECIIKHIQIVLDLFYKITAGITVITAVYITVFWGADTVVPGADLLWQILITSGLCSLSGVFITCDDAKETSKKGMLWKMVFGFIYVNMIVLCCGTVFEWFYLSDWKMLFGMEASILAVFLAVVGLSYFSGYKTAQQINAKLKERK